jgi:hypothetical protein
VEDLPVGRVIEKVARLTVAARHLAAAVVAMLSHGLRRPPPSVSMQSMLRKSCAGGR